MHCGHPSDVSSVGTGSKPIFLWPAVFTICCLILVAVSANAGEAGSAFTGNFSHRGAFIRTALPFREGEHWRISNTEVLLTWAEYSPHPMFQLHGAFAALGSMGVAEASVSLHQSLGTPHLYGAVSATAGIAGWTGSGSGSWQALSPFFTYQNRDWDVTGGVLFLAVEGLSEDDVELITFSLFRFRISESLSIMLEASTLHIDEAYQTVYNGYLMPLLRWEVDRWALDIGVGLGYRARDYKDPESQLKLRFDGAIPLPYVGFSVGL